MGKLSGAGSDAGPIDCPGGWRHRAPSALRRRRTGVLSSPQVLLLGALMLVLGSHAFVFTGMRPRDDAAWALLNSQRHRAGWTGGVQLGSPLDQPSKATVVWSSKGAGGSTAFKNKRRWRDGDELDDVRSLAAIEDQLNNHHRYHTVTQSCRGLGRRMFYGAGGPSLFGRRGLHPVVLISHTQWCTFLIAHSLLTSPRLSMCLCVQLAAQHHHVPGRPQG